MSDRPLGVVLDRPVSHANDQFSVNKIQTGVTPTILGAEVGDIRPAESLAIEPQSIEEVIKNAYEALYALQSVNASDGVLKSPQMPATYEDSRILIETVLIGWDRSNAIFQQYLGHPEERARYPGDEAQWYEITYDFLLPFHDLLQEPLPQSRWQSVAPLTQEEIAQLGGYRRIWQLIRDEDFVCKRELGRVLLYDLGIPWKQYKDAEVAKPLHAPLYKNYRYEYEKKRDLAFPLLRDLIDWAVSRGEMDYVGELFEHLARMEDPQTAVNLLFDGEYSDTQRLQMFVQYANIFGFINTIDTLAYVINQYELPESVRRHFETVYKSLQGDEVEKIMNDLSQLYQSVDFHEYTLNSKELTEREADLLEEVARRSMQHRGMESKSQLRVLDVGAGTGRLSEKMMRRGYTGVTAFEYEAHHIERIRQAGVTAVQGDWHGLTDTLKTHQTEHVVFSFGRTISHNRTPSEMFHFFDEVQDVVDDNGVFTFDQPDVNWGGV